MCAPHGSACHRLGNITGCSGEFFAIGYRLKDPRLPPSIPRGSEPIDEERP